MERPENEQQATTGETVTGNGVQSNTTSGEQRYRQVIYTADTFTNLVNELYPEYPDEWIAIAILEETPDLAFTGELIAHSPSAGVVSQQIKAYGELHAGRPVAFFSTELATVRRRRR